jgi:hypothetical protein
VSIHSTLLAHFQIRFYASIRHFTFAIAPFPYHRLRRWFIWIWRTDGSIIATIGHLWRLDPAYLAKPCRLEKGALIPDIRPAVIMELVQRCGGKLRTLGCELTRSTGKRFNVLHQRTDSWHYEVDQLILGTLLFTLFTFSLPTLLTYALLFTLVRNSQFNVGVNAGDDLVMRVIDEVRSAHHVQDTELRRQSNESFPTVCSSVKNQGPEKTTR